MALISMTRGNTEAAIEAAALRSDRFRQEREPDWKRLELIVTRMEKGRIGKLSDADLLELPVLYRTVASSLSVARETSLDAATLAYLDSLVQRAWFLVYGPRTTLWSWLRRFFGGEWSRAVRAITPEILVALALMVAGTVVGWMLCAQDPDWFYAFVSPELAGERVPGATREVLREGLFGKANEDGLSVFAASLFSHNSSVSILMYALGFAFGVPTLMLVVQNTTMLGAILWLYNGVGLDYEIAGWLAIHGTTELFALLLAGAAGLHVGRSMAFPGELSVAEAAAAAGQRTATVMAGVVLMLLCAGMLEGLGRQLVDVTATRLAIGGGMLVFWLIYFFLFRHVPQGSED
ncbi:MULTISPECIES: stage II sporulation protein M [unclassified Novosphingobium]|uniref:stage II sporulation protein M n=1 Tax=unclassified Novosphingobium TaxID=2644732 RepID=UPI0025F2114E|nr:MULTISPECIES: stage II sporulation protein M [unclassified Novosphingobium]HQV04451.1 stage II sporulation protein M [Novosphingobium sp.]